MQHCVTARLKLPESRLQNFVHPSASMNPSQGIYGGMGAALVSSFYNSVQRHSPHLLKSYTQMRRTKGMTKTNAVRTCVHRSTSSDTSFLREVQHSSPRSAMFLPLSRKELAGRPVRPKNIVSNRGTPASSYLPTQKEREFKSLMEMRCVRALPILVTCKI